MSTCVDRRQLSDRPGPSPASPPHAHSGPRAIHVLLLLALSIAFEARVVDHGINLMDEGWPLHAAMELDAGKTLYDEVFWVFPPGHLFPAGIAYALDPPGVTLARTFYAAFAVALCLSLYFLATKLMPPDFALLAAAMVAISAPQSHVEHHLFGYRYLVWSIIALLCFQQRLRREDARWMFAAGLATGIALLFRLTPAFAVSMGIGVGILAASREWRSWLRDAAWYGAGLFVIVLPLLSWFQQSVGIEKLWLETVLRPIAMTSAQSLPLPELFLPEWTRPSIVVAFVTLGFRLYAFVFATFLAVLLFRWWRARREGRAFEHVLLLSFVVFGGVYFARSLGRSDWPHLDSALPPAVVLLAYCASLSTRLRYFGAGGPARGARTLLCVAVFLVWASLNASDRVLSIPNAFMGDTRLEVVAEPVWLKPGPGFIVDRIVRAIENHSEADETLLVMSHAPMLHVLSGRHSPGYHDVVMPGTFLSSEEEQEFIQRLQETPPAVVLWPRIHFDSRPSRGINRTAPQLARWVSEHYAFAEDLPEYVLLKPRPAEADGSPGEGKRSDR